MSDAPVKRGRGRPRKHPRPEDQVSTPAASVESEPGSLSDDEFFEAQYAKPVTGKRMNILSPTDETLTALFRLGRMFCTQEEAAAFLGVNVTTLRKFLYDYEEAMSAWQDGLQNARVSLRRKQMALAGKLAPMAIFLGKNYLGQKDINESVVTHNKAANELSEEDLEKIASRGMATKDKPIKAETKH